MEQEKSRTRRRKTKNDEHKDTKCDIELIGEKHPMNSDLNTCNYYC